MYIYIYIYIYINIDTQCENFLPSHHARKRTPRTSRLVPSHRVRAMGEGINKHKIFHPSHHAQRRTRRMSRLVPSPAGTFGSRIALRAVGEGYI